jgi:hypothetical protein
LNRATHPMRIREVGLASFRSGFSVIGISFVLTVSGSLPRRWEIIQHDADAERQGRNLLNAIALGLAAQLEARPLCWSRLCPVAAMAANASGASPAGSRCVAGRLTGWRKPTLRR